MNHVTDRLESWLADELSVKDAAMVEQHLAFCPECAARADELRQVWSALGSIGENTSTGPSIWPQVRSRTVGLGGEKSVMDWLFKSGESLRAGLAATALAAGLALAFLFPAGPVDNGSTNIVVGLDEISDLDWLEDSTHFGSETGSFLHDLWLGTGLDEEGDGS